MQLEKLLEQKQEEILSEWFDRTINTYPKQTAQILGKVKDRFSNPIGSITLSSLEPVFQALLKDEDRDTFTSILDPIIRVRAVQAFSSAEATGFIFFLKTIIRKKLDSKLQDKQIFNELLEFESKLDGLTLIAFDIYMECREKLYHIKATEERNRTFSAFERAGLIKANPVDDLDKIFPLDNTQPVSN